MQRARPGGGSCLPRRSRERKPRQRPSPHKPSEPVGRNENFKTDWHDAMRGISCRCWSTRVHERNSEYYRDVNYRGMMSGGIDRLDAVINTHGLEKTFPGLADADKRGRIPKFQRSAGNGRRARTPVMKKNCYPKFLSDEKEGMLAVNARTLQLPEEMLISEFADGALATLDPFTNMIWPGDVPEFTKATQGEFSGIGIQILPEDNGDLRWCVRCPTARHYGPVSERPMLSAKSMVKAPRESPATKP